MKTLIKLFFIFITVSTTFGGQVDHEAIQGKIISKISIIGNKKTRDHVIKRELQLVEGQPYDSLNYRLDVARLKNIQLFTRSQIQPLIIRNDLVIVISVSERWYFMPLPEVQRRERDWRKWSYGMGIVHTNVQGKNIEVFAKGWAGFNPGFLFEYDNPWFAGNLKLNSLIEVYYGKFKSKHLEVERFDESHKGFTASLGKRWKNTTYLYLYGGYDKIDYPLEYQFLLKEPQAIDFASYGLAFRYDTRDLYEYPRSGIRFESYAARVQSSHRNYFSYGVDARFYKRIQGDLSIGFRLTTDLSDKRLPVYAKRYLGYLERIRGEYYTRNVGDNRFMGSVELKVPLVATRYINLSNGKTFWSNYFRNLPIGLSSALFVDYGKLWNKGVTFVKADEQAGFGAGLHVLLPYSVVFRLEYAMDLNFHGQLIADIGVAF